MQSAVRWTDWNGQGLEHCVFTLDKTGLLLCGAVAGTRHGLYGGHYTVRTDENFVTREVRVRYTHGPLLHVKSDGHGHWRDVIQNKDVSSIDGCFDVDIGITPATNTLPIKRLMLETDQSQNICAAYVPLPDQISGTFLPIKAEQRYTCLEKNKRYRYEGIFRAFTAELEVDNDGLVIDYPDTFRRLTTPLAHSG